MTLTREKLNDGPVRFIVLSCGECGIEFLIDAVRQVVSADCPRCTRMMELSDALTLKTND